MRVKQLGYSNLNLSVIGIGAWAFGGSNWSFGWAGQEDLVSISAIHHAIDLGINWVDTAAAYGYGHAEEVVGKALVGKRDQLMVATKGGLKTAADGWNFECVLKADSLRKEAEDSLRRLNVDVIDLYQIHKPFPDEDIEEAWGVVADLIKDGKVHYGGVSIFNVDQIKRCQAIHPVAAYQPPYSMLVRGVEEELLSYCAVNNIGVITYSPMRSGLLTGKLTLERLKSMKKEDWRTHADPEFQGKRVEINLELVEKLKPVAARLDCSLSQLAIAWVLRRSEVTAAIVGARRGCLKRTRGDGLIAISSGRHMGRPLRVGANLCVCPLFRQPLKAAEVKLPPEVDVEIARYLAERDVALTASGEPLSYPW